jgi:very-short-patch-repair endonuclease
MPWARGGRMPWARGGRMPWARGARRPHPAPGRKHHPAGAWPRFLNLCVRKVGHRNRGAERGRGFSRYELERSATGGVDRFAGVVGVMGSRSRLQRVAARIATLADGQHGVIAVGQLLEIGLSYQAIQQRVQAGYLHPIHRGVFAVGGRKLSLRGRWMAAVLATGEGALLSHWSGAALRDLASPAGRVVHVIAPGGSRLNPEGIVKHRARNLHPEERDEVDGIPVCTVSRLLLDLAPSMSPGRLMTALEDAEKRGDLDAGAIRRVCGRNRGHRGARRLLRALARYAPPDDTRSPLERRFSRFCRAQKLPIPSFNVVVEGHDVDVLWPQARLIVELDSWKHHGTRGAFERDRARDAELMLAGYRVMRLTWRRLSEEPERVAGIIRRLLTERGEPRQTSVAEVSQAMREKSRPRCRVRG